MVIHKETNIQSTAEGLSNKHYSNSTWINKILSWSLICFILLVKSILHYTGYISKYLWKRYLTIKTKPESFLKPSCVQFYKMQNIHCSANKFTKGYHHISGWFWQISLNNHRKQLNAAKHTKLGKSVWNLSVQLLSYRCENPSSL